MAKSNLAPIGRFSSQMLTYLGAQRNVNIVNNAPVNVFKYEIGPTTFAPPANTLQANLGKGVVGSFKSAYFDSVKCYFLSRNSSVVYADTMAALIIDTASILNVSPQRLLNQMDQNGLLDFTSGAYRAMNMLRDPGNQIGKATTPSNNASLQSRQIRA
jgi:hypothetical protein